MSDIDKLSRKVPQLCKVAPSTQNTIWKMFTVLVVLSVFSASWIVRGY